MKLFTMSWFQFAQCERHTVSVYSPNSLECPQEKAIVGPLGYIVCFDNHEIELDLTVADLTGVSDDCLAFIMDSSKEFSIISKKLDRTVLIPDTSEKIIVLTCLGADIKRNNNLRNPIIKLASKISLMDPEGVSYPAQTQDSYHTVFENYVLALKLLLEHGNISTDEYQRFAYLNEAVTKLQNLGYMLA